MKTIRVVAAVIKSINENGEPILNIDNDVKMQIETLEEQ